MPPPDRAHGAWVSKIGSRVKHVGIVDRQMAKVPWRPICNQHAATDEIRMVGQRGGKATELAWWVDLNPTAWPGRKVCGNCIRVIDELNQMLTGNDADREQLTVSDVVEQDGGFIFPPASPAQRSVMTDSLIFNAFDVAEYRGYTIERRVDRTLNRKGWAYVVVGKPTKFTSMEAVTEEVDYLIERYSKQRSSS